MCGRLVEAIESEQRSSQHHARIAIVGLGRDDLFKRLYGAGILRFRKGRTNWEYISALSPQVPWRGEFVTLTRNFEHQWYGSDRSPAEALDEVSRRARGILESVRRGAP